MPASEQEKLKSRSTSCTELSRFVPSFPDASAVPGSGDIQVFSMETKTTVMVGTMLSLSWLNKGLYTAILSGLLFLFLLAGGKRELTKILFISYVVVFFLYLVMMHWGIRLVIVSAVHVYMWWKAFPGLIAAAALVSSPPGMISAFLSKLHCPKKMIVGVLVIFRFFPTASAACHRLNDALKNRQIMSFTQILRNPLDSLEYLLVPIMMALINSADRLASSAVARGAEAPAKRTSYYYQPQSVSDYICQIACVLITAAGGLCHFLGVTP